MSHVGFVRHTGIIARAEIIFGTNSRKAKTKYIENLPEKSIIFEILVKVSAYIYTTRKLYKDLKKNTIYYYYIDLTSLSKLINFIMWFRCNQYSHLLSTLLYLYVHAQIELSHHYKKL